MRCALRVGMKRLAVDGVRMGDRPVFDGADALVPKALVEPRRLKAMACEDQMSAIASPSLRFGTLQDCLTDASSPVMPVYPEMRDDAHASPRMAAEAGDKFARIGAIASTKKLPVGVPGCFGVELVDALDQRRIQLQALSFVEQFTDRGIHGEQHSPS